MELYHHGIKGQKWGVRRFQNKDGSLTAAGRKRQRNDTHDDYSNAHVKKSVKSMSNQELQSKIKRMQLEQQYADLTRRQRSESVKFVNSVLKEAAKNTASFYVSKYMRSGVDYLIEKNSPYKPRH